MNAPDSSLRRLSALASAIAGHPMEVLWTTTEQASTDGRRILLSRDHIERARTTVVVQAVLVAAGSLHPAFVRQLRRSRRRVRSRYVRLEVARALVAQADRLPARGWDRPVASIHTDTASESLSWARSRRPLSSPPPEWGVIDPKAVLAAVRNGAITSTALSGTDPQPETQTRNEDDAAQVGNQRRRSKRAARRGRSGQGVPADFHRQREVRRGRGGASIRLADSAPTTSVVLHDGSGTGKRYPEWDCYAGRLRPHRCTVVEVGVEGPSAAARQEPTIGAALSRVRLDHARVKGQLDGDSIDPDAAIRARIDVLSGHTPDERMYSAHLRRRTPIGVFVLIDMSGSLARHRPAARSAAELHRSATAILLDSMQQQGDRTAAAAFRSFGRSRVEVTPLKRFNARFDLGARADLGRLRPSGFTRMGAAIRFAGDQLRGAGTRRRLLIVITDGLPFDQGYEGEYANQDTSHALDELFVNGIGTVCLAVGDLLHTARLADVFGTTGFLHLNGLTELRTRFPATMRQALLRVENASRRTDSPRPGVTHANRSNSTTMRDHC